MFAVITRGTGFEPTEEVLDVSHAVKVLMHTLMNTLEGRRRHHEEPHGALDAR